MKLIIVANLASNIYGRKNLIRAIQAEGWTVSAAACADYAAPLLPQELSVPFEPVHIEIRGTRLLADIRTFFGFLSLYRKTAPDAVVHFTSKPDIYGSLAASLLGIPSISNITGLGTVFDRDGGLIQTLVCQLYRMAFAGKKAFVFFQNRDDRRLFIDKKIVAEAKTGLLPGSGVDIARFRPSSEDDSKQRDSGPFHFLFIGRLVLSKGIREYITAASIVQKSFPGTIFDIIGENADINGFLPESELKNAQETGQVVYHGNTGEVSRFIAQSDCVVLPSYYREGVPRALLEAAAMGKPLIAADSIGTREPVRDGLNGYLCEPQNPDDLAEKMMRFISLSKNDKHGMGKESRILAEKEYSDTIVNIKYLEKLLKGMH